MATRITTNKAAVSALGSSRRSLSTSVPRFSRRQVLVELLDDVSGLGQIYDRMTMNPGRARNELVPNGLARIVPWKRNLDRTSAIAEDKLSLRDSRLRAQKIGSTAQTMPEGVSDLSRDAAPLTTPSQTLASLYDLPPSFAFARRTINAGSDSIHGSLTLGDIATRLQEECGLSNLDVEVVWRDVRLEEGARIRSLGSYDAVVRVKGMGQEEAPLSIEITPLHE